MIRFKIAITLLFSLFCLQLEVYAQQVITNSNGEKIVVFPDGSWRHFVPADSVLIRENLRSDMPFNRPGESNNEETAPADPTLGRTTETRLAIEFANELKAEADKARLMLVEATNQKFNIGAKLEQARENENLIEVDILANLEEDYEKATGHVKNAKRYHSQISKFAEKALSISNMEGRKKQKKLSRLMAKHSAFLASSEWKPEQSADLSSSEDKLYEKTGKAFANQPQKAPKQASPVSSETLKWSRTDVLKPVPVDDEAGWSVPVDRSYERAPVACNITVQEIDEATNQKRLLLDERQLFTHTDEELRPYFRDESLVDCRAYLSSINGFRYLTVKFIIASPNARRNFGMLQKQALLRMKLIDGTYVNFYNIQADRGRIDRYSGNTIYTGNYALGSSAERQLLRSELDKIRVVWSTGYEDYDIHEVDFFMHQLECLNNY